MAAIWNYAPILVIDLAHSDNFKSEPFIDGFSWNVTTLIAPQIATTNQNMQKNDTYSPHMDFVINLIFYFTTAFFWAITFGNPSINDWMALIWNYQIKNQSIQKTILLCSSFRFLFSKAVNRCPTVKLSKHITHKKSFHLKVVYHK